MQNTELVDLLLRDISSYKALNEKEYEFKYEGNKYIIIPDCVLGSFDIVSDVGYDYTDNELPHILDKVNNTNSYCFNSTFFCADNKVKIKATGYVAFPYPNIKFIDENRFRDVCEDVLKHIENDKSHVLEELPHKKNTSFNGKSWILWLVLIIIAVFLLRSCFSCGSKKALVDNSSQRSSTSIQNTGEDFPFTAQRVVSESELSSYSDRELSIMRNEIFARHGYIFKRADLKEYFSTKPWYNPQYSNVDNMLSKTEKKNVEIIGKVEKKRK